MRSGRGGFTLIELIFVIAIIAVLVSMATIPVTSAREKARQVDCMSNLRNIGVAIVTYRGDHGGNNPDWISCLYPSYVDDLSVYVCRSDPNRGHGPVNDPANRKYEETCDNDSKGGRTNAGQNDDVKANSYFYEFSSAMSDWSVDNEKVTWSKYKEWELREGNDGKPYSSSRMPIVRCYHHSLKNKILAYDYNDSGDVNKNAYKRDGMTLNVAYAGNVVIAPLLWQAAMDRGK